MLHWSRFPMNEAFPNKAIKRRNSSFKLIADGKSVSNMYGR